MKRSMICFASVICVLVCVTSAAAVDFLIVDQGIDAIIRVNQTTGNRTIVSNSSRGTGPVFQSPWDIAWGKDGNLYVVDSLDGMGYTVFQVDPESGNRTVVSDKTNTGPAPYNTYGLTVESSGDILVTCRFLDAVVRIDQMTGNRTMVSSHSGTGGVGSGPSLDDPFDMDLDRNGDIMIADISLDAIVRIDPVTGDRTIVSGAGVGSGDAFRPSPSNVAVGEPGHLYVSVGGSTDVVYDVDSDTGDRTFLFHSWYPAIGSGPLFSNPGRLLWDPEGHLLVCDSSLDAVFRIDPVTKVRTIISDDNTGSGPQLMVPRGMVLIPEPSTIVLLGIGALGLLVCGYRRRKLR